MIPGMMFMCVFMYYTVPGMSILTVLLLLLLVLYEYLFFCQKPGYRCPQAIGSVSPCTHFLHPDHPARGHAALHVATTTGLPYIINSYHVLLPLPILHLFLVCSIPPDVIVTWYRIQNLTALARCGLLCGAVGYME